MKTLFSKFLVAVYFALFTLLSTANAGEPLRVGFYSGTFDPPHAGHRSLIERSVKELNLDVIIVVAGAQQTHKPGASSFEVRDKMIRAAFSDIPQARFLNDSQIALLKKDGIEGLQKSLSEEYKDGTVYQIMGDDSLERLAARNDISFPKNFKLAVAQRESEAPPPKTFRGIDVVTISADTSGLSSTKMRKALSEGLDPSSVEQEVLKIIHRTKLYGAPQAFGCSAP